MKERFRFIWHSIRASYCWNRMIAKQERTELSHKMLTEYDARYNRQSIRYNESINVLIAAGRYITANSLIAERRKNEHSDIATASRSEA